MLSVYQRNCHSLTFYEIQFFLRLTGINLVFYLPLRQFNTRPISSKPEEATFCLPSISVKIGLNWSSFQFNLCILHSSVSRLFQKPVINSILNSWAKFSYYSLFDQSVNFRYLYFVSWSTIHSNLDATAFCFHDFVFFPSWKF